jgi:hypothetical protein
MFLDKVAPGVFLRADGPLHRIPSKAATVSLTPALTIYIGMSDDTPHGSRGSTSRRGFQLFTGSVYSGRVLVRSDGGVHQQHGPSHATVRVVKGIPERYWDQTNQRFFLSALGHTIILAFSLVVTLGGDDVDLLCLIDQRKRWTPCLFRPSQHPELYRWFLGRKAARENTYWEDLPGHWLQRQGPPTWIDIMIAGMSYSFATSCDGGTGRRNPNDSPNWEISTCCLIGDESGTQPGQPTDTARLALLILGCWWVYGPEVMGQLMTGNSTGMARNGERESSPKRLVVRVSWDCRWTVEC